MAYTLRHYQETAIRLIMTLIMKGVTAILAVAPTGAGKTVIAAALIELFLGRGARILFVAHRDELIEQCCRKLAENGVAHGVIKAGRDGGDLYARVHVASVQTFIARLRFMRKDYDLIIFDEAHHSVSDSFRKIIAHCTSAWRRPLVIGLTATPYRADGKGLGEVYQEIVTVSTTAELINEGFLVPPRLYRARIMPDTSKIPLKHNGDYNEDDMEREMSKPRILGHAVNEFIRVTGGRPMRALGFYVNKAHARLGCEAFCAAGVPAEYVDDSTPTKERKAILDRLRAGKTLYVANCGIFTEGFDEPRLLVVQGMRPTKSRGLWRQIVGRGARPCPEIFKTHFLLLDHCGWTSEHGRFTDPDRCSLAGGLAREQKDEKQLRTCPACGARFVPGPKVCPDCGAPLAAGGQEDTIGLGDGSVTLEEDAPFFGGFSEQAPSQPKQAWTPRPPNTARVARRSRGL